MRRRTTFGCCSWRAWKLASKAIREVCEKENARKIRKGHLPGTITFRNATKCRNKIWGQTISVAEKKDVCLSEPKTPTETFTNARVASCRHPTHYYEFIKYHDPFVLWLVNLHRHLTSPPEIKAYQGLIKGNKQPWLISR